MIKSLLLTGLILSQVTAKQKQTLTTACIVNDSNVYLTINDKMWMYDYTDLGEETDTDYDGWYDSDLLVGLVESDNTLLIKTDKDSIIIVRNVKPCI